LGIEREAGAAERLEWDLHEGSCQSADPFWCALPDRP
jgi:hypothetical protein